jgi:hypothetical protein
METGKKWFDTSTGLSAGRLTTGKLTGAILLVILLSSICGTVTAATPSDINEVIEDGVAWLAAQQNSSTGHWQDGGYTAGPTGLALIALQERAFELGYTPFDPCYPYKQNVEKGLAYLFSQISVISISNQPHGNPDTDGDGKGVYVKAQAETYDTGIAMMAIAASRAPNRVVNSPGSDVNGWTYKEVLVDMVDYMAFGQYDYEGSRGGWGYIANIGADNSNSGYAVSGLGFAESCAYGFNCAVPQFVKNELKIWIDYIQTDGGFDDGGSGYADPGSMVNILKTGNLVFQMTFAGIASEDPNFQRALTYLGRKWNDPSQDPGWGNPAYGGTPNYQAMYCTANGLWYSNIWTIMVDGKERDWYADFADALVNAQDPCGYWSTNLYGGDVLATEWALVALKKTPIVTLKKVDDVNEDDCVVPGDEINYRIDYNYPSWMTCPGINDVSIIDYLPEEVEFISASSDGTYNRCSHTVTWNIGNLHPGDSGFVTLKVKVKLCVAPGSIITNKSEIKGSGELYNTAYEHTPVCCPTLKKEDNIPDGNCVGPGDKIIYNICYAANGYGDTNVVIVDDLPDEVEPNNLSDPNYDISSHTYTWHIGTLEPNESGCVNLTVKVKSPRPGGVITNFCEIRGDCMVIIACEDTPVCRPTLTKVDNITGCVGPGSNIIYDINYAANGYRDTNVVIIDELPDEVNYISSDPCGAYNPGSHTVTWDIGTLEPSESGSVSLTVKVNYLGPGSTIRNKCEIRSDEQILRSAYEYTPKCGCSADPCMIKLDFNYTHDNNDANTQVGFTRFIIPNSGSEVNGVVIDLGGNLNTDRRDGPCGTWAGDPPVYYPRAGERIYRDFIYSPWPGGVTITLWGLGVNRVCDISIYSFDDLSIPRRLANWTANGNYLLTTDFNGGMINWPGYEGQKPEDLYKYAFTGTATTDYLGRIVLESTAYPSCCAEGEDFAFVNALTVVPIGIFIPTKYAHRPVPFDGAEDVPVNTILKWRKGKPVVKHDLYLGTDETKVTAATRASHPNVAVYAPDLAADANKGYDPYGATGFLKLDTTYYWRIDENSPGSPYGGWKGETWSFKTLTYSIVDDFESYIGLEALKGVWEDWWIQPEPKTSAEVWVEQTIVHSGYQSMRYVFWNKTYEPYYSEANATIGTGDDKLNIDPNWFGMGAIALSLWFYGDAGNPVSEHDKMYIKLVDSATPVHTAKVMYDGGISDLREQCWHEWNIALQKFVDNNNVNLRKVAKIIIGFGDGTQAVSDGNMYFDDIRLYTTKCVLADRDPNFAKVDYAPSGSPAGDCVVDYQELKMMVDDWLMEPPIDANVDLYYDDDCTINFKDFAILADRWLEEELWP